MVPLQFRQLVDLFPEAQFVNLRPVTFTACQADSRRVRRGDLFVAIRGVHVDGHQFIGQAEAQGACALVVESAQASALPQCIVPDTRRAFARLCHALYGFPARRLTTVGVTGTNGKTTTCFLIRRILAAAGHATGLLGTVQYSIGPRDLDSSMTTPDPPDLARLMAEMVHSGHTHAVMEVSSHSLDQRRVEDIPFAVGVFTNLTGDHLDYHGTLDHYRQAKGLLFRHLAPEAVAVLNADDPASAEYARITPARVLTYALKAQADVQALDRHLDTGGGRFMLATAQGRIPIHTPLLGEHNVANCLAAASAGLALGVDLETIKRGIETLAGVPGRLEPVDQGQPFSVVVDYAHTDDALLNVLSALRPLVTGRLLVVFGAGGNRDRTKRPRMGRVVARLSDLAWVTNDNPRNEDPAEIARQIVAGADEHPERLRVVLDRREAIGQALAEARPGDAVLIAGKGHETTQETAGRKVPFDDRQVAREWLNLRAARSASEGPSSANDRNVTLGQALLLEEIRTATGAHLAGAAGPGVQVRCLATDSRSLPPGALFWAIPGERFDGHDFVEAALQKGAMGVVVSRLADAELPGRYGAFALVVPDTVRALGDLARAYRQRQRARVIAVTGSAGKTTTREMIYTVLAQRQQGIRSGKSFNNAIGLPLTVFRIGPRDDFAVLEMGTSAPGEIDRLAEIAAPDIGVITAVGEAHLEGLKSLAGVAAAKAELLHRLKPSSVAVLNMDNPWVAAMKAHAPCRVITVGTSGDVDLLADRIQTGPEMVAFRVNRRFEVRVPLPGRHNVTNALLAIGVAWRLGLSMDEIGEGLARLAGLPMRCQVETIGGVTVINDAYNANLVSMRAGLELLAEYRPAGRRWLVCGDMRELGEHGEELHRQLGREVAGRNIDLCVSVGDVSRWVTQVLREAGWPADRAPHFATCEEAAAALVSRLAAGDVVLVKASRAVGLERLVDQVRFRWGLKQAQSVA